MRLDLINRPATMTCGASSKPSQALQAPRSLLMLAENSPLAGPCATVRLPRISLQISSDASSFLSSPPTRSIDSSIRHLSVADFAITIVRRGRRTLLELVPRIQWRAQCQNGFYTRTDQLDFVMWSCSWLHIPLLYKAITISNFSPPRENLV